MDSGINVSTSAESFGNTSMPPGLLLVTAKRAAELCGKSLRTWRSWDSAGRIPGPVRIGRSTLWRVDELRDWTRAGCPPRCEWQWPDPHITAN